MCDRVVILHRGQMVYGDHLAADHSTLLWRIRLAPPADYMTLSALPCVQETLALGDDRFRVVLEPGHGPEDLARQAVEAGLGLRELTAERSDLERVFFDLIGAEDRA